MLRRSFLKAFGGAVASVAGVALGWSAPRWPWEGTLCYGFRMIFKKGGNTLTAQACDEHHRVVWERIIPAAPNDEIRWDLPESAWTGQGAPASLLPLPRIHGVA